MKQYLQLLERILTEGERKQNRTGIDTLMVDAALLQFDLTQGFPAVTTKKLAFNAVKGELIGFIHGYTSAQAFRNLGCKIWDQNANENTAWLANPNRMGTDDLGRIYGAQWRGWYHDTCGRIDQLKTAVQTVQNDPDSRRIIVSAWNPADLNHMALPPCHLLFQLLVNKEQRTISMTMYQRSCDMFLGVPFNIASYALLLELICAATGYTAKRLSLFLADVHIYCNHLDQVREQLAREVLEAPKLGLDFASPAFTGKTGIDWLEAVEPHHVWLENYAYHAPIKAEMAV